MPKFFKDLVVSVSSSSVERDHRAIQMCEKRPVFSASVDDVEMDMRKLLTEFAAQHVIKNYKKMNNVNFTDVTDSCAILKTEVQTITTRIDSCSCGFFSSMGLPCCHIFKFRLLKNLPVFEDKLCLVRWTRSYF